MGINSGDGLLTVIIFRIKIINHARTFAPLCTMLSKQFIKISALKKYFIEKGVLDEMFNFNKTVLDK